MKCSSFVELNSPYFSAAGSRADLVRVRLSRLDIAVGRVGRLADLLMQLSDSRPAFDRWKNRLIISVETSSDESRNASETPEVVKFFRELTSQWPYWLHYAEKDWGTVGAVLRLLTGTESMRQPGTRENRMLADADAVRAQSKQLYDHMRSMYRCHGIDEAESLKMAHSITAAVNALFQKSLDRPDR